MAPAVLTEPLVTRDARPADEEALYEIVNGQHVDLPPMSACATWIASRLDHRLGPFVEEPAQAAVKGIDAIKPTLDELEAGETVFPCGRRLADQAPEGPAKEIRTYCRKLGLDVQR
jgi:hypothetical protein